MCVPVHSEKGAKAIIDDYVRQIESCQTKYPISEGLRAYIKSRWQQAQAELQYFQRYERWLLNYDVATLQPKPAPKVVKDPGLARVKRALQPARLRKVKPDTLTGVEAIERGLTVGALLVRGLVDEHNGD